jgi:hypothetical protein
MVTAVDPASVVLRIVHVHGRATVAQAHRMAAHERSLGWPVAETSVSSARSGPLASDSDVVVLHGTVAGFVGRLLLRGSRATVLVPRPGRWCAGATGRATVLWERWAARWTSAVVLADAADAAAGVRRHVWVPPFVVGDSAELSAAVLTRAHAFGAPSARLAEVADTALTSSGP